jgi:bacterioferritin
MKGNPDVIALLNEGLCAELTAINQFFIHSKINEDWGYRVLAKKYYEESIEEMKHAEKIIARILFLEGLPNMQKYHKILVGDSVPHQYENDLNLEMDAVEVYNRAVKKCVEVGDNASRALFEDLLVDEENHVDWIETQLSAIQQVGLENYLAQKLGEDKE